MVLDPPEQMTTTKVGGAFATFEPCAFEFWETFVIGMKFGPLFQPSISTCRYLEWGVNIGEIYVNRPKKSENGAF